MIKAVIFDMDGILLDTEPYWQEVEMEVFATVGLHLTREECMATTGFPVKDVVYYRYKQKPWNNKSLEQVAKEIVERVKEKIREKPLVMDGAIETINFFKIRKIPIAVASSSEMELIKTALGITSLINLFDVIHSTEFEKYGKPHPDVFITTARKLSVEPEHCMVFEDSINGVIATKAARMKSVAIVHPQMENRREFEISDLKLKSLRDFSEKHWQYLNSLD